MTETNSPRSDDAVLGSENITPLVGAVVLGGLEGVKHRLARSSVQRRLAALQEALKYGEAGLGLFIYALYNGEAGIDLAIAALNDKSEEVIKTAYLLLQPIREPRIQSALKQVKYWELCKTVDYTQLQNFLASGRWKEADKETCRVMLEVASIPVISCLDYNYIEKFPSSDLNIINRLWLDYSNGHFGFSVQKQIWLDEFSGKINGETNKALCARLGWGEMDSFNWKTPSFRLDVVPPGYLPRLQYWKSLFSLLWRADLPSIACKEYGAYKGCENIPTPWGAVIWGGLKGVKHRLASSSIYHRIATLPDALNYGEAGLELAIAALNEPSLEVRKTAYQLLQPRQEPKIQSALKRGKYWELNGAIGDYTQLQNFLANGSWIEADNETFSVILKVASRESDGWLDFRTMTFPCVDLCTINQIWLNYSNGRFGFSVQKQIWLECGGKIDFKTEKALRERVGWSINSSMYNRDAFPPGYFPSYCRVGLYRWNIFSRFHCCGL